MLIVSIGELLWDRLPVGRRPGGASANLAVHARRLGADAVLVSRVGDDDEGRELTARLADAGVDTRFVQVDPARPTGWVDVSVDAGGVPDYTIHEGVAWDFIEAAPDAREVVAGADAVCFGTLAQRHPVSRSSIGDLILHAARSDALRVCDVNLRRPRVAPSIVDRCMRIADVVKLNQDELTAVSTGHGVTGTESEITRALLDAFDLDYLAVTRGANGSRLRGRDSDTFRDADSVEVADTVGAGDAFSAALTVGLLKRLGPCDLLDFASLQAARACTHAGAWPPRGPGGR